MTCRCGFALDELRYQAEFCPRCHEPVPAKPRQPRADVLWAAIRTAPGPLTSRNLAASTGIPVAVVSAMLRRYADRGQLTVAGLGPRHAGGGLRATVYRLP